MVTPLSRSEPVTPAPSPVDSVGALVRQVQAGNRGAFEQLYHQMVGRVYALCLRMLADPHRAAEVTQDVFVRAWQRIGTYRFEAPFEAWLKRIAVRQALNARRSRRRWRDRFEAPPEGAALDPPGSVHPAGAGLDLARAIAALPEKARLVVVLHDVEGYRHAEIADLMDVTVGTTKAQLHRARHLLRAALNA